MGYPITCDVAVADPPGVGDLPTGSVTLQSSGSGSFTACELVSGAASTSDCAAQYTPTGAESSARMDAITASYPGASPQTMASAIAPL